MYPVCVFMSEVSFCGGEVAASFGLDHQYSVIQAICHATHKAVSQVSESAPARQLAWHSQIATSASPDQVPVTALCWRRRRPPSLHSFIHHLLMAHVSITPSKLQESHDVPLNRTAWGMFPTSTQARPASGRRLGWLPSPQTVSPSSTWKCRSHVVDRQPLRLPSSAPERKFDDV